MWWTPGNLLRLNTCSLRVPRVLISQSRVRAASMATTWSPSSQDSARTLSRVWWIWLEFTGWMAPFCSVTMQYLHSRVHSFFVDNQDAFNDRHFISRLHGTTVKPTCTTNHSLLMKAGARDSHHLCWPRQDGGVSVWTTMSGAGSLSMLSAVEFTRLWHFQPFSLTCYFASFHRSFPFVLMFRWHKILNMKLKLLLSS